MPEKDTNKDLKRKLVQKWPEAGRWVMYCEKYTRSDAQEQWMLDDFDRLKESEQRVQQASNEKVKGAYYPHLSNPSTEPGRVLTVRIGTDGQMEYLPQHGYYDFR